MVSAKPYFTRKGGKNALRLGFEFRLGLGLVLQQVFEFGLDIDQNQ